MNFRTRLYTAKRRWSSAFGRAAALALLLCCLAGLLPAQNRNDDLFPPKPVPAVFVHDYSGWLSADQRQMLEQKLRRYSDSTSTQIVVMIRPDIGDYDKATYAFELGDRWGIGRKSKDNGIVMLVKSEAPERGIFIATGRGAEGALPDITAGRIIRNTMAPYFRQNRYYEGINAGLDDIFRAMAGEFKNEPGDRESGDVAIGLFVFLLFVVLFLIVFFAVWRSRRKRGDWYTHDGGPDTMTRRRSGYPGNQGGWGGGWWIGGGSSGGSWGDSGGGGSSWSDNFGGGDFGGGGAGGDW